MAASPNLSTKLALRSGQRLRADLARRDHREHPRGASERAGEERARAGRLRQGQPGQAHLRHVGHRQHLSPGRASSSRRRRASRWTHVPYKGAAPAIQDVLAGHVQVMFDNMSSAIPNMKAGRVRALGVASLKRYPALPDVPTIDEQGVPGYETTIWLGLFAPAKTPPAVLQRLQTEIGEAVGSAEYKREARGDRHAAAGEHFAGAGGLPQGRSREVGEGREGSGHQARVRRATPSSARASAGVAGRRPYLRAHVDDLRHELGVARREPRLVEADVVLEARAAVAAELQRPLRAPRTGGARCRPRSTWRRAALALSSAMRNSRTVAPRRHRALMPITNCTCGGRLQQAVASRGSPRCRASRGRRSRSPA